MWRGEKGKPLIQELKNGIFVASWKVDVSLVSVNLGQIGND
jgi:hypothetical protein